MTDTSKRDDAALAYAVEYNTGEVQVTPQMAFKAGWDAHANSMNATCKVTSSNTPEAQRSEELVSARDKWVEQNCSFSCDCGEGPQAAFEAGADFAKREAEARIEQLEGEADLGGAYYESKIESLEQALSVATEALEYYELIHESAYHIVSGKPAIAALVRIKEIREGKE